MRNPTLFAAVITFACNSNDSSEVGSTSRAASGAGGSTSTTTAAGGAGGGASGGGAAGEQGGGGATCFSGVPCADYGTCADGMECNKTLGECQAFQCGPDGAPCSLSMSCASLHCADEVCSPCDCLTSCEVYARCFNGFDDVAACVQGCEDGGGDVDPCVCPYLADAWCTEILKCWGG